MGYYYPVHTPFGVIETYYHDSGKPGRTLFSTGAVHGDEKCGTTALERTIAEIESGVTKIKSGSFVAITKCNPLAFEQDTRFSKGGENLNRVFAKHAAFTSPERAFAHAITEIVDRYGDGKNGYWLDLHSYYDKGGKPFAIVEYATQRNLDFANALGVPHVLLGWNELYADPTKPNAAPSEPCTIDYGHLVRGMAGLTVECGGHKDAESVEVAYKSIQNALAHLGMVDAPAAQAQAETPSFVLMERIVRRPSDDWKLAKAFTNLEPLGAGAALIADSQNNTVQMPFNGLVLLPNKDAVKGAEFLYVGKAVEKPATQLKMG